LSRDIQEYLTHTIVLLTSCAVLRGLRDNDLWRRLWTPTATAANQRSSTSLY